jgi:excisionase family DNA binding protein
VEQFYSVRRAARRLAVSEKFLRKLQRAGRLRVVRLGRAVRISEQELTRLCREEFQR